MAEILSRSWLFEIVDTKTSKIERSFTLILPPQQYTIKEPQRVNITKTFGNTFIDDYGADNLEITIKGISGTARIFPTYSPKGVASPYVKAIQKRAAVAEVIAVQGYDQRSAFFKFRNDIMRYKDRIGFENRELRVYDLHDSQAYKCMLLEFILERTSNLPFRYSFTISLFVYERLDQGVVRASPIRIWEDPFTLLDYLDNAMLWLTNAATALREVRRSFARMNNTLLLLRARLNTYFQDVTSIVTFPLDLIGDLLISLQVAASMVADARDTGKYLPEQIASITQSLNASLQNTARLVGFSVSAETGGVTVTAVDASTREFALDTIVPEAQELQTRVDRFTFNAYIPYIVKGGDTLQSIARDQLGNSDLWIYIAQINAIESNQDLVVGDTISIPITSETSTNKDAYILTEDRQRDPYGADIGIEEDGGLAITDNGDLQTVGGLDIILQAVDLALSTPAGTLIKESAYGLVASVGQPGISLAIKYLRMNIKNTLLQDPRIELIENVALFLNKDAIQISMDITPVGYDVSIPVVTSL